MVKKGYIKLWLSYQSYFEAYSATEVGDLVLAMLEYCSSGTAPAFSGNERFIWPAIQRDIDEAISARERASGKNAENGKMGGRPKKAAETATLESEKCTGLGAEAEGQEPDGAQGQGHGPCENDASPSETTETAQGGDEGVSRPAGRGLGEKVDRALGAEGHFAPCGARPEALPLDSAAFEKAGETFSCAARGRGGGFTGLERAATADFMIS